MKGLQQLAKQGTVAVIPPPNSMLGIVLVWGLRNSKPWRK
jgi:hypothetical protein